MKKWFGASVLAFSLLSTGVLFSALNPVYSQPRPLASIYISDIANNVIDSRNRVAVVPVLVTLFSQGQPIRNTTIGNSASLGTAVTWPQLEPGPYEVHFEARGYGKVIKRVVLTGNTVTRVVFDTLTKSDELWGPGPSISELQSRIVQLEKENQDMKGKVANLEKQLAAQNK